MHKFSTASPKTLVLTVLRSVVLPSVSLHRYGGVRGERDGVKFAKRQRHDVTVHRGGGATKKLMPSRRHPSGWWELWATSVSLVVVDVPASPSPCSLISPRKTHQRTLPYLWNEALNVPYSTLASASVARLASPALSALRDENLCIIRAGWVAILALGIMFGCAVKVANETYALSNLKRYQVATSLYQVEEGEHGNMSELYEADQGIIDQTLYDAWDGNPDPRPLGGYLFSEIVHDTNGEPLEGSGRAFVPIRLDLAKWAMTSSACFWTPGSSNLSPLPRRVSSRTARSGPSTGPGIVISEDQCGVSPATLSSKESLSRSANFQLSNSGSRIPQRAASVIFSFFRLVRDVPAPIQLQLTPAKR